MATNMDSIYSKFILKINTEREILDLCNGYCKISGSMPCTITHLIAIFYFIRKITTIGKLRFRTNWNSFTSLITSIIIRNPIFKIDVKIGSFIIKLFLNQNKYNTNINKKKQIIQTISGIPWNSNYVINQEHSYYKPKQYRIIALLNRETNCNCIDSKHGIKVYILNFTTEFNCSLYTLCRQLEKKHDDNLWNQNGNGLIKIPLTSDVQIQQQNIEIIMNGNDSATIESSNIIEKRICCWDINRD